MRMAWWWWCGVVREFGRGLEIGLWDLKFGCGGWRGWGFGGEVGAGFILCFHDEFFRVVRSLVNFINIRW